MSVIFGDFDFSVLADDDFKEDAVREELILPIIKKLGYTTSGASPWCKASDVLFLSAWALPTLDVAEGW
jgi:hypothetical protein